jgi:alpha-tubulin suppressor-like RCC1 family protein
VIFKIEIYQPKYQTGEYHTILIDLENNIWTFGDNRCGQLGIGNYIDKNIPTQILNLKVKQVSVGGYTILIDIEDNIWAFGVNFNGQLGLVDFEDRNIPTQIPNLKAR